jgi:hypothetical protein
VTSLGLLLQVARAEADTVDRFVGLLDRDPTILDRIARATVWGGGWCGDEELAYSQLRPQLGWMLGDCITRSRTRSTVLVAADNAVFLRMLATGARKLAPGIIRVDDVPSRRGMSAILNLGLAAEIEEFFGGLEG